MTDNQTQAATTLIYDIASSAKDWSLPEEKAVFSAATAVRAMLEYAARATPQTPPDTGGEHIAGAGE